MQTQSQFANKDVCTRGFVKAGSYSCGPMILGNMKSYFNLSGPIKRKKHDEDIGAFPFCRLG